MRVSSRLTRATAVGALVRVASWNINTIPDASPRFDDQVAVLQRIGADAVALQELDLDAGRLEALGAAAGYPYFVEGADTALVAVHGGILSKYPIASFTEWTPFKLSADAAAVDLYTNLLVAEIELPFSYQRLHMITVQYRPGATTFGDFSRAVSTFRAVQVLDKLSRTDAIVISGDFNVDTADLPGTPDPIVTDPGIGAPWVTGDDVTSHMPSLGTGLPNDPFSWLLDVDRGNTRQLGHVGDLAGVRRTNFAGLFEDYMLVGGALVDSHPMAGEIYDSANEGLGAPIGELGKFGAALASGVSVSASDHLVLFADIFLPEVIT